MVLDILAKVGFIGLMSLVIWIPFLLVITLATPRFLLEKYLKEPHFNRGELIAFSSFPTFFMRTALFCRLYLTPKAVEGRKLYGFVEDSPKWYRVSVLLVSIGCVLHMVIALSSVGIVYLLS